MGRYLPEVSEMFDFRAERVIRSVDESLERLGLTYIDVIQVGNGHHKAQNKAPFSAKM